MLYTPPNLNPLFAQYKLIYSDAYVDAPSVADKIATTIPSATEMNVYAWMDFLGAKMRVWYGERYVRNLVARGYSLPNLTFELTVEVPRTKIEDDQYGLYGRRMDMLGRQAKLWPDDQLFAALINGGAATSLAFDGVPFFSSSHLIDPSNPASATQSNDLGLTFSAANFVTGLVTGKSFRGRDGIPLGVFASGRPLLVVGPLLEKPARDVISANFLSPLASWGQAAAGAPSSNTYLGSAELLVTPWITSPTAWYLIDTSFGIMPLIWQLRLAPQVQTRTDDTNDPVFTRDMLQFGLRARGAAGYALPFLAIRGNS